MNAVLDALVIGAGPFGIATEYALERRGSRAVVIGSPLSSWRAMPEGMLLRTYLTRSFDPFGDGSLAQFLDERGINASGDEPFSRELFLAYADWFLARAALSIADDYIVSLAREEDSFAARARSGQVIRARAVVVATGVQSSRFVPPDLVAGLPESSWSHSSDHADFKRFRDLRLLIIGGRMGAHEWGVLMRESGVREVHIAYRHDVPRYMRPDWTWAPEVIRALASDPGWFKRLPEEEKRAMHYKLWYEGRTKIEPWLASRVRDAGIRLHPRSYVDSMLPSARGLTVRLRPATGGALRTIEVDHVMFATGYKPNVADIACLSNLRNSIALKDGYPVLSDQFESSVPGLYFTGRWAEREFGPLMGFMVMCKTSASIIARAISRERALHTDAPESILLRRDRA